MQMNPPLPPTHTVYDSLPLPIWACIAYIPQNVWEFCLNPVNYGKFTGCMPRGGFQGVPPARPLRPKWSQFHAVFLENLAKSYVGASWRVGAPSGGLRGILDPPLMPI